MCATDEQPTKTNTRKIVLKENCWIETSFGVFKIKQDLIAEAVPKFFSNGELAGYHFSSSSFIGVTYDLERTATFDDERGDLSGFETREI